MMYSKEERDIQIENMTKVSNAFYSQVTRVGVHAFIEFTGLMNKFIDICRNTSNAGVDFNECNTHTGDELVVHDYDLAYLAEKMDCIFGPTLADEGKRRYFFRAMGWPVPALESATVPLTEKEFFEVMRDAMADRLTGVLGAEPSADAVLEELRTMQHSDLFEGKERRGGSVSPANNSPP